MSRKPPKTGIISDEFIKFLGEEGEVKTAPIRLYLSQNNLGELSADFERDSAMWLAVNAEFNLTKSETDQLTTSRVAYLFRQLHRLRNATTDEDRQQVLTEVSCLRDQLAGNIGDPPLGGKIFLRALSVFPAPKAAVIPASVAVTPEAPSVAMAPEAPPPQGEQESAATTTAGITALDPAIRAVAAAYALLKAGKPVTIRSVCKAAGVDRKNLTAKHPETIKLIEQLGEPDRKPPSGKHDRRTGNLDALDDSEDE